MSKFYNMVLDVNPRAERTYYIILILKGKK